MEKIEKFKSELLDNIFEYIQCISIFVYKRNIYYLIDYKENFELNAKIFFDIYLLENQKICIIHELGAIITDKNFTRENSVSTDIISDWKIDKINKLIILTELDSDKIISLNYD